MRRTYATRHEVLGSADKPEVAAKPKEGPRGTVEAIGSAKPKEGHRETVEAIVVAMILALLVRGFEAEAFVIPTGSMAPTLMGRHKEINCPQCGFLYSINASDEVEGLGGGNPNHRRVSTGICVNCRYQAPVADAPSFKGDRILVMKFPYDMPFLPGSSPPRRWDIVVFRYPEEPEVSYIKRLVGLPGEVLNIYFGDVYLKSPNGQGYQLARKPLKHQQAMQMMVYDDTHRAKMLKGPEWRRWTSSPGWSEVDSEQSPGHFKMASGSEADKYKLGWAELRYRHLVPDPEQWDAIVNSRELPRPPRATLITDFYSYNTNLTAESSSLVEYPRGDQEGAWMQPHWVGDLSFSSRIKVDAPGGRLRFELVEGGTLNHCEIDLATGKATLRHGDKVLGEETCPIDGPGTYDVTFANVDDRLTLVVDGRGVFGDGVPYDDGVETHPAPTAADLSPAAVAAQGAAVEVSDLVLKRDIYYTLYPGRSDYSQAWEQQRYPRTPVELFDILSDPSQFPALGNLRSHEYAIGPDNYLMLGDNSPRSKDSRGWDNRDRYDPGDPPRIPEHGWDRSNRASWEVPRSLVTGKAFFVYWPHGKPFGPDIRLSRDFRVPFLPYFARMKWIR
jgi:signal peptidase I